MKRFNWPIWLLIILAAALLMGALGRVILHWGAYEYWLDSGGSISEALGNCGSGGVIYCRAGSYTVDKASATRAVKIVLLDGASVSGTDTLISASANLNFVLAPTASITSTDVGHAFPTSSNATLHFFGGTLNIRRDTFADSVWMENCTINPGAADSVVFNNYADLLKCTQKGYRIVFGIGAKGKVRDCSGYSTVAGNLLANGNANLEIVNSYFETVGFNSLAYTKFANVKGRSSHFVNNHASLFAVDGIDSVKGYWSGCQFDNLVPHLGSAKSYAFQYAAADTVWMGNCGGTGNCKIDSSSETGAKQPIAWFFAENNFDAMNLFDGVTGTMIHSHVRGPLNDRYMFNEQFFTDTDSLGLTQCTQDTGVVFHFMDKAGNSTFYANVNGQVKLYGPDPWLTVGATGSQLKLLQIYNGTFTTTANADTVVGATFNVGDIIIPLPYQVTGGSAPSAADFGYIYVPAGGDTAIYRRANSGTSALQYYGIVMRLVNP
jgi:hypothetical protein